MLTMCIFAVIALGAAAGLGFQIGMQRGLRYGVQIGEECAMITSITNIIGEQSGHE